MHFEVRIVLTEPAELRASWIDLLASEVLEAGLGGFEERELELGALLIFYAETPQQAARCAERLRAIFVRLRAANAMATPALEIVRQDFPWATAWMEFLTPANVTTTISAYPLQGASAPDPAQTLAQYPDLAGKRALYLRPTLSFGEGSHATTQLCAQAIEDFCASRPAAQILDVGTGSGVLSFVALMNGARSAVGIDIDAVAVAAARVNAELNHLAEACRFSDEPLAAIGGRFDLVAANLDVATLEALAEALLARLEPQGRLLVSGVLAEHGDAVSQLFERYGAVLLNTRESDAWVLLELGSNAPLGV